MGTFLYNQHNRMLIKQITKYVVAIPALLLSDSRDIDRLHINYWAGNKPGNLPRIPEECPAMDPQKYC